MGMPLNRQGGRVRVPPGGRARENRKFIQASSPEIWRKTIFGGEGVLAGKWGGLFLGYLLGRNYRRRDGDRLVPLRWMDAAVSAPRCAILSVGMIGFLNALRRA